MIQPRLFKNRERLGRCRVLFESVRKQNLKLEGGLGDLFSENGVVGEYFHSNCWVSPEIRIRTAHEYSNYEKFDCFHDTKRWDKWFIF